MFSVVIHTSELEVWGCNEKEGFSGPYREVGTLMIGVVRTMCIIDRV